MGSDGVPIGRRVVLGMLGLGAVGVLTGRAVQHGVERAIAPVQNADPTGISGLVPTGSGFRYYSVAGGVPTVPRGRYRLQVGGLVERPLRLTLDDLRGMPQTHLTRDFQCVTGWRVSQVPWSGVLLRDLLDRAGVLSSARAVTFLSFDGIYTDTLTLTEATRSDVLVALRMLGAPVTPAHGGPVRLYVAPMYGYKSVKWLGGIALTAHARPGYWEGYGYDVEAWVGRSNGRHDART